MKNQFSKYALYLLLFLCQQGFSNGLQFFNIATYQNPAAMQRYPSKHLASGILVPNFYDRFRGTVLGQKGTVKSSNTLTLPYVMFSDRLCERISAGFDYSNPVYAYVHWPVTGFQRFLAVDTVFQTYEVTPKICFAVTENFSIGFSFRYVVLWRSELNYVVPIVNQFVLNRADSQGYGGAIGFWWKINPKTMLDFCGYTPIKTRGEGESMSGPFVSTTLHTNRLDITPATFVLNFTRIFNDKFLANARVIYSLWSSIHQFILSNTSFGLNPVIFNLNWKDCVLGMVSARYQVGTKAAFLAIAGYDQACTRNTTNIIGFPIENLPFGGFGGEYRFSNFAWLKAFAGVAQGSSPKVQTTGLPVDGEAIFRLTWVDVSATIDF